MAPLSPLEHFFSAIWLNPDPSQKYVLMATNLSAYFDASYNTNPNAVHVVAGFISSAEKWLQFEKEWTALLSKKRIIQPFHMNKFATHAKPYDKWHKNNPYGEIHFYQKAMQIVKRNTLQAVVIGSRLEDLEWVRNKYDYPLLDAPPYLLCGLGAIFFQRKWAKKHGIDNSEVETVFEEGDRYQYMLMEIARNKWKTKISIREKSDCVPLQASDFLAWEMRRTYVNFLKGRTTPRTLSVEMFKHFNLDQHIGWWDRNELERICKSLGTPRQPTNA